MREGRVVGVRRGRISSSRRRISCRGRVVRVVDLHRGSARDLVAEEIDEPEWISSRMSVLCSRSQFDGIPTLFGVRSVRSE